MDIIITIVIVAAIAVGGWWLMTKQVDADGKGKFLRRKL